MSNFNGKRWTYTIFDVDSDVPYSWQDKVEYTKWQREKCPNTGKEHLQGWLIMKKKHRLSFMKKMHPTAHWEPCAGSEAQNEAYCSKVESRIDGPWHYGDVIIKGQRTDIIAMRDLIKKGGSLDDCKELDFETYAKYHTCLEKEYVHLRTQSSKDDVALSFRNVVWKDWQSKVIQLVAGRPDDRKVHWYYDEVGNTGKSFLTRYLVSTKNAYLVSGGRQADILYAYDDNPIVIFDIARTYAENADHFYTVMEVFKNGMYLNTKYVSKMRVFKVPHVIIFANFHPNESKMSMDRWDINEVA